MAKEKTSQLLSNVKVKKPGILKAEIRRRYGDGGFTATGTIRIEILTALAQQPDIWGQRARLALSYRSTRKK